MANTFPARRRHCRRANGRSAASVPNAAAARIGARATGRAASIRGRTSGQNQGHGKDRFRRDGRDGEARGDRPPRTDRPDRRERSDRPSNDRSQQPRQDHRQDQRHDQRRERPTTVDPNSPFAALLALKARMEADKGGS